MGGCRRMVGYSGDGIPPSTYTTCVCGVVSNTILGSL